MRNLLLLIVGSFLLFLLSACGADNKNELSDAQQKPLSFASMQWEFSALDKNKQIRESWGDAFSFLEYNIDYYNSQPQLAYHEGERCQLIQISKKNNEKSSLVECLEENKRSSYMLNDPQGVIADIVFLDNGNLVLLEIVNAQNEHYPEQGFLKITTLNKLREKVAETYLHYVPTEHERTFYSLNWDQQNSGTGNAAYEIAAPFPQHALNEKTLIPFRTAEQASMEITGNDIYLMAHSYVGLQLYHYDENLEQDWAQQVMPIYDSLLAWNVPSRFSVDARGYVYVATNLARQATVVWENHFGKSISGEINRYEILIISYDEKGNYLNNQIVGSNDDLSLADISVDNERILVSASNRIKKSTQINNTTEWDLMLIELSLDLLISANYSVLDFDKEDSITGHQPLENNEILVWGRNGFLQVDTNSHVSNGKGFIKKVTLRPGQFAEIKDTLLYLEGPRDVDISAVLATGDNQLWVAGSFDGPITHTAANERHQKVMVGTLLLSD